ncbi:cobalamin biosynthesis protein CobW [Clostridium sp. AF34-13]|uniref:CobW family GTP-binding protein n=1 Tax=Clostridium sp. AF34-13 TaxID=2293012 RepID=UPI000E554A78|nr:CobW family GTP-binding protein [Clostridium sp. AF34-13]RHP25488.1 cobalamin biosynthesis protein CobW [Clostridium sp. AF34-13]
MAKIDIISGFLGAGKTTLIKKLVADAFQGEKLVIIENEFGEIGIDGGFLKESGIQITEMNSGCICCSLVGDFGNALKDVLEKYSPDRVIIEPSGVGKLSDVIKAVKNIGDDVKINSTATVVDASKCKMYMKNYGEFYNNQIESAGTIILSRTQNVSEEKLAKVLTMIKEKNDEASVITTPWDQIDGKKILDAMEKVNTLEKELLEEHHHHDGECGCGHEHHHHDHDGECGCGHEHHHHDHDEECGCGHEHHHDHDEECGCGHEHHHDHDGECGCGHEHHHHDHDGECGCGHHHEHGHHHADDVFTSWGVETAHKFTEEELKDIVSKLASDKSFGDVLRAKGIVASDEGEWFHFDLVPEETELRRGAADYTGRICVIGSNLNEDAIKELFHVA